MTSYKDSLILGAMTIPNRVVMAPMTRNRADENGDPNELMREYYMQRASIGLIITEGTAPEHVGKAYPGIPGIYTDTQENGWKLIADGVHSVGGHIFMQLMHSGRISHKKITGVDPVAPSAVKPAGELFTGTGMDSFETPLEMSSEQLNATKAAFVDATSRALRAGLDGVELHAANGYLLHQFLAENSNTRVDQYGGTPENRARYVLEVLDAVLEVAPSSQVGIRISPNGKFNDIDEVDIDGTYSYLISELNRRNLAYLHVANQAGFDGLAFARERYSGILVANSGYGDKDKVGTLNHLISTNQAELFSLGRMALANPDLMARLNTGADFNAADSSTFYSRGAVGYTDYPGLKVT